MTHERIDMEQIYEKYPVLRSVEERIDARFERRRPVLNHIPKWKRGVEIGVFTGQFSELLVQVADPIEYYAVDPWFTSYGEFFPNWGEYSENGTLPTRAGYEAAQRRLARFPGAKVVAMPALDWLATIEAGAIDWAYVDSTHQYVPTLAELNALAAKLAPGGVLLGDDCWCNRANRHYGVFRAVRDFCRSNDFEIMIMDHAGQWAARKSID